MSVNQSYLISVAVPTHKVLFRYVCISDFCYAPAPRVGALSDDARLTSVWRPSVAYIGPKSRTEMPKKTKIGKEVAHVTRVSDITFKVKRSKLNLQGAEHIVAAFRTACSICFFRTTMGTTSPRSHRKPTQVFFSRNNDQHLLL